MHQILPQKYEIKTLTMSEGLRTFIDKVDFQSPIFISKRLGS